MTLKTNSAEGGSNGVIVSPANSGGTSGDAWTTVRGDTAFDKPPYTSSSALSGSLSILFDVVGYAVGWSDTASASWSYRWEVSIPSAPLVDRTIMSIESAAGVVLGTVKVLSGTRTIRGTVNATNTGTSASLTAGSKYTITATGTGWGTASSVMTLKVYDASAILFSSPAASAAATTASQVGQIYVGSAETFTGAAPFPSGQLRGDNWAQNIGSSVEIPPAGFVPPPPPLFPLAPLPIKAELQIAGVWTDVTSEVQRRGSEGIDIRRGRADEAGIVAPGQMSMMLNNQDGRFSPRNPTGLYFGSIGRNTPTRVSIVGPSYLQINQETGNTVTPTYVSTPDAASLDITGDIELMFDADLDSWREAMELVSKWTETGNQRSYRLYLNASGFLFFSHSTDGTNAGVISAASTSPVPITSGRLAVRATMDVNDGLGNRVRTFYTAPTIAGPWTQLGTPTTTAGVTSIFSSSAALRVLDNPDSSTSGSTIHGKVYAAKVLNGLAGTVAAFPDFTVQSDGLTMFTDTAAVPKIWTLTGDLTITTRNIRFFGEVTNWPQKWDLTGTDVWVPLEASGVLRRLGQGTPPLDSTLKQGIQGLSGVRGYWPMEDEALATAAASGLANGSPMKVAAGTPSWASDDSFKSSKPIMTPTNAVLVGKVNSYTTTNIIQLQFLLHVPTGGTVNNSVIVSLNTSGTAARWDLIYTTGGSLNLQPYDSEGVNIAGGTGAVAFAVNGKTCRISIELVANGANIDYKVAKLDVDAFAATATSGSVAGRTVRNATKVTINNNALMVDVGIGHVEVNDSVVDIFVLQDQLDAYNGETAGRRIERLCRAQDVDFRGFGDLDDSRRLGYQLPDTFLNLVQEAADSDLGLLFEDRESLALCYRPLSSLYGRAADATLNYASFQTNELEPVEDDQLLRNDVTVTRAGGSSARVTQTTGPLSISSPTATPPGVGVYDTAVTVSVFSDDDLPDQASWRVRVGTIDQSRYPLIGVNLANIQFSGSVSLTAAVSGLDSGSRLVVSDPPAWIPPDDINQIVQGYREFLSNFERLITFNCSPALPYDTAGFWGEDAVHVSRYSSDGSTLATTMTTTATSVTVATPSGPLWITTALVPADLPFDIMLAGEQITVGAISGTSSPQTFSSLTRSVNGVVKTHAIGEAVELFSPAYYAL